MAAFEEYKIIKTEVTGEVNIHEHSQYNNLNADRVVVHEAVRARLYGTIHRLLVIKKDARVFLHGKLFGKVEDEGGRFYHFEE